MEKIIEKINAITKKTSENDKNSIVNAILEIKDDEQRGDLLDAYDNKMRELSLIKDEEISKNSIKDDIMERINNIDTNTSVDEVDDIYNTILEIKDEEIRNSLFDAANEKTNLINSKENVSNLKDDIMERINNIDTNTSADVVDDIYSTIFGIEDEEDRTLLLDAIDKKMKDLYDKDNENTIEETKTDENNEEIKPKNKKTKLKVALTTAGLTIALGTAALAHHINTTDNNTYNTEASGNANYDNDSDDNTNETTKDTTKKNDLISIALQEIKDNVYQHSDDQTGYNCLTQLHIDQSLQKMDELGIKMKEIHNISHEDMFKINISGTYSDTESNYAFPDYSQRYHQILEAKDNTEIIFCYMFNDLHSYKYLNSSVDCISRGSFQNLYGMQTWIESLGLGLDFDYLAQNDESEYEEIIKLMVSDKMSYDDAYNQVEEKNLRCSLSSPAQKEETEDILYTLFDYFYQQYGIEDYYYILSNDREKICAQIQEDLDTFSEDYPYIPMCERNVKTKVLHK